MSVAHGKGRGLKEPLTPKRIDESLINFTDET
jgi:hypothetical protein